jgi:transposase
VRSFDPTFEPNGVVGVRRLEVITGVGGRRSWSRDDKARIVAESVYAWRRLARTRALVLPAEEEVGFVPILATGGEVRTSAPSQAGIVEIDVAGTVIRAAPGVDLRHLRDVLRAVKAAI